MSRLKLRLSKDYQAIAHMDSELFNDYYPIENWDSSKWWIGTIEGKPICYCGLQTDNGYGYLVRAGVMPEYQGQGLQQKMIKRRVDYCIKKDINFICTETVVPNPASMSSLINVGFRPYVPKEEWSKELVVYWRYES